LNSRLALTLIGLLIAFAFVLIYLGPIAQDETYHSFADSRTIFGIPNFWNVISNLPFAFVGALGVIRTRQFASRLLFAGVFLTRSAPPTIIGRRMTRASYGTASR
jgi:hypothetical protein